jgi:hypothetical protein
MSGSNGVYHDAPPAFEPAVIMPPADVQGALIMQRTPEQIIDEAMRAAKAIHQVVENSSRKLLIIDGQKYLWYEHWQTLGRFYGVTVGSAADIPSRPIEIRNACGYEATAEAILVSTGAVIGRADGMCLDNEYKWVDKPDFQLRSMAQTRACAKALRNILAWVVVLAGYEPTPAEEMEGQRDRPAQHHVEAPRRRSEMPAQPTREQHVEAPRREQSRPAPSSSRNVDTRRISDGQINRLFAIARDAGYSKHDLRDYIMRLGFDTEREITRDRYQQICAAFLEGK